MTLKNIWDNFTDFYSFLIIHPQYFIKKYDNSAVIFAQKYAKGNLLDIGCGRMPYRDDLVKRINKYVGLDFPTTAKLYHGKYKPELYGDAQKLKLKSNSFNTALSLQVIEHLQRPQDAISEMYRILEKGGIAIVSTVQSYPIHDEPHDYYRYTKYGLQYLLKNVGFKILEYKSEGNVFVQTFQNFNVYLMLKLKTLIQNKKTIPLALIFITPILIITTISNLLAFTLQVFDKKSKFAMVQTFVAKK